MPKRKPIPEGAPPTTFLEAIRYFSDPDRAHAFVTKLRFPNGVACPRMGCGSAAVGYIATRRMWQCKECKKQSSVKVGTIFEDSPIGLDKWLPAMWMIAGDRNGISSCELARQIGVTQKTAWFMLHRIRLAMKAKSLEKLGGYVEADETFIGGKAHNKKHYPAYSANRGKNRSKGPAHGKTIVMGMIERYGGRVRAMKINQRTAPYLQRRVRENVAEGSTVYTDALPSYRGLKSDYIHYVIDHAVKYVEGHVHTNTIENFWSCLKRTLAGTYIAARPEHLEAYLDEQVFRFNNRELPDAARFEEAFKGGDGKRVTYAQLIANGTWANRPQVVALPVRRKDRPENPLPDYTA
jgi:transposase-like protein